MMEINGIENDGRSAKEIILDSVAQSEALSFLVPAVSIGYFIVASIPLTEAAANLTDKTLETICELRTKLLQAQKQKKLGLKFASARSSGLVYVNRRPGLLNNIL